ncbi:MAG: PIN domain-containing protein [Candidatus Latescibacteria bacterium]|nr:PIN domain-containing protein [Candidatus Latescibacterota bacterium]
MRIYLDCCCLQRPFDDKSQPRIAVEAEAVLVILALCETEQLILISSDALLFEIDCIPDQDRKDDVLEILKLAKEPVELTQEIEILARRLEVSGIKPLDALHLASASVSKIDYFCTCDDKFLKKAINFEDLNIKVVSPTELVMELDI